MSHTRPIAGVYVTHIARLIIRSARCPRQRPQTPHLKMSEAGPGPSGTLRWRLVSRSARKGTPPSVHSLPCVGYSELRTEVKVWGPHRVRLNGQERPSSLFHDDSNIITLWYYKRTRHDQEFHYPSDRVTPCPSKVLTSACKDFRQDVNTQE